MSRQSTIASRLRKNGVHLVDARQLYVDDDVPLDHIYPGATLYPGVRLHGADTVIGPNARIGSEGPATLINVAVGSNAEIASGFVTGSAILANARLGPNSHVRSGSLIEEAASTAHAVGLKHTILMSFVTLGSLINLCDALVAGGRSQHEHSEIGSGFVHFNFAPWGPRGDKATPSLFGDVTEGVFLDNDRLFIGGLAGIVGPRRLDYGSMVAPGSILRKNLASGAFASAPPHAVEHSIDLNSPRYSKQKVEENIAYISQLFALYNWYVHVRARFSTYQSDDLSLHLLTERAIAVLLSGLGERVKRLNDYLVGNDKKPIAFKFTDVPPRFDFDGMARHTQFVAWVKSLASTERQDLRTWLLDCVDHIAGGIEA